MLRKLRTFKSALLSLFRPEEAEQITKSRMGLGRYDLSTERKAEW
ncbi:MAG: hypothetical protein WD627_00755 [Actinomycetota bacterium]